ncbi:proprotein convertase P-domain-containing protein [Sandaracinus amylolyticus]|uniref:proprotein convertase P-domain-containing protein n=1 Tax=Sandaracinus amylolyticus TaxID=927083 RepID=UPI001F3A86E7|nr:proprotein convertase P-domain-containing protein [Sandaracinus amylolyticus]UJR84707.1 Hypothetical protein I5071_67860 [Sandaracinus amylolyticus]
MTRLRSLLCIAALLVACGGPGEPRFAEVTISSAAPSATLSGSTRAVAPAIELSPGCPGYLDPAAPEHVVHLDDATAVTITARSSRGPLALAISGGGEVRCDSDGGAGHAPHVTVDRAGDYAVHVASLHQAEDLQYELVIAPAGSDPASAPPAPGSDRQAVSVTVTSDPPGASVRTPEGQVLGTTPAMFVIHVSASEIGTERRFVLDMPGRPSTEVSGRLIGGAVVMHATLPGGPAPQIASLGGVASIGATMQGAELVATASSAQPIRDYQVARQAVDVNAECTVARATVDVDIRHSFIGDLRVVLRAPSGTEVTLHDHGGAGRANLVTSYDWNARRGALQRLAGQSARGQWTMAVHDDAGADTGTFRSFTLRLACVESGAPIATQSDGLGLTGTGGSGGRGDPTIGFGTQSPPPPTRPQVRRSRPRTTTMPPQQAPVLDPWGRRPLPPQPPPPPQPWQQSPTPGSRSNGGGGGGRVIVAPMG